MDRQTWEKRQQTKEQKREQERIIRNFGGRFSARGIQRPLRADGTMMSDREILSQEGAGV